MTCNEYDPTHLNSFQTRIATLRSFWGIYQRVPVYSGHKAPETIIQGNIVIYYRLRVLFAKLLNGATKQKSIRNNLANCNCFSRGWRTHDSDTPPPPHPPKKYKYK